MTTPLISLEWLCETFYLKPWEAQDFLERKGPEIKEKLAGLEELVDEYIQEYVERRTA
jgi:hypothetical protein